MDAQEVLQWYGYEFKHFWTFPESRVEQSHWSKVTLRLASALRLISDTEHILSVKDFIWYRSSSVFASFAESIVGFSLLNYTSSPLASTCSLVIASCPNLQTKVRMTRTLSSPIAAVSEDVSSYSAMTSRVVVIASRLICVGSVLLTPTLVPWIYYHFLLVWSFKLDLHSAVVSQTASQSMLAIPTEEEGLSSCLRTWWPGLWWWITQCCTLNVEFPFVSDGR